MSVFELPSEDEPSDESDSDLEQLFQQSVVNSYTAPEPAAAAEPEPAAAAAPQPALVPQPPSFSDQMYEEAHQMLAEINRLEAEHKAGRLTDIEYYEAITDLHENDTCMICGFANDELGNPDVTPPCGHHIHS
eukprot:SAG11_NODE_862_length_6840_cov_35.328586_1_plen_133_part_00